MTSDEFRLPAPPSDYDAAEREAWFAGARTVASTFGSHARLLATAYDSESAADSSPADAAHEADTEPDAAVGDRDTPDDSCPRCGSEVLVTPFGGGERCNDCGYSDTEA